MTFAASDPPLSVRVPPLMLIGPVKLSMPESVSVPEPDLVSPPLPPIGPAKVKLPPPDTVSVFDRLTALFTMDGPLSSAASVPPPAVSVPESEHYRCQRAAPQRSGRLRR